MVLTRPCIAAVIRSIFIFIFAAGTIKNFLMLQTKIVISLVKNIGKKYFIVVRKIGTVDIFRTKTENYVIVSL